MPPVRTFARRPCAAIASTIACGSVRDRHLDIHIERRARSASKRRGCRAIGSTASDVATFTLDRADRAQQIRHGARTPRSPGHPRRNPRPRSAPAATLSPTECGSARAFELREPRDRHDETFRAPMHADRRRYSPYRATASRSSVTRPAEKPGIIHESLEQHAPRVNAIGHRHLRASAVRSSAVRRGGTAAPSHPPSRRSARARASARRPIYRAHRSAIRRAKTRFDRYRARTPQLLAERPDTAPRARQPSLRRLIETPTVGISRPCNIISRRALPSSTATSTSRRGSCDEQSCTRSRRRRAERPRQIHALATLPPARRETRPLMLGRPACRSQRRSATRASRASVRKQDPRLRRKRKNRVR